MTQQSEQSEYKRNKCFHIASLLSDSQSFVYVPSKANDSKIIGPKAWQNKKNTAKTLIYFWRKVLIYLIVIGERSGCTVLDLDDPK